MPSSAISLLSELARFTAETFVAGLWQGLILIAAVAICLRLLTRIPASIRFAIWSFTFSLVVAIPLVHLRTSASSTGVPLSAVVDISPTWAVAIATLWATLTITRLTLLPTQILRLHQTWKGATPVAPSDATLATLQSPGRDIQLCTSPDIDSPCVIGFLSPRLLLPASLFGKLTEAELNQIVLHECEHLRRRDDWVNLAQKIALAIFPLNPALLFVDRRLSLERELACDAGVIARTEAPFDYARSLTRLAEHRLHTRRLSLALSAWAGESELARRVHTLLRPMSKLHPVYARVSVGALSVALTAGAVELTYAPHLVSFTCVPVTAVARGIDTVVRPASPQPTPVLFNQAANQPHATLLKATLPSTRPATASSKPALKQQRRSESVKPHQPRLLRTAAPQREVATHYGTIQAYYVVTEFSPSYAAVPFGDGWLIVQL